MGGRLVVTYNGQVFGDQASYDVAYGNTAGLSPTTPTATAEQQSAKAIIDGFLAQWGLGALGSTLWTQYLGGQPMEQIMLNVRQTAEYKARFPYMDALAQKGRAISESQAIDLERTFNQIGRSMGLPDSMLTTEKIAALIAGETAPTEFQSRAQLWRDYADEIATLPENQQVVTQLREFGILPESGDFLAWAMDPAAALPELERKWRAGELAAQAARAGVDIDQTQANLLVGRDVTAAQAQEGFNAIAQSQELFGALPGSNETAMGTDEQIGAVFGLDPVQQAALKKRQQQRVAAFAGGGGFSTSTKGVSGLGNA